MALYPFRSYGGRMSKGKRHCVEEMMEPSGKKRCVRYALGPKPKGSAISGGRRMSKGVRHCLEEMMEPSGKKRCARYAPGPRMSGGRRMPKGVRYCLEEVIEPSGKKRCARYAPGPRPRGSAMSGGVRISKGVRHCAEKVMLPSGKMHCIRYMPGPKGSHVSGGRRTRYFDMMPRGGGKNLTCVYPRGEWISVRERMNAENAALRAEGKKHGKLVKIVNKCPKYNKNSGYAENPWIKFVREWRAGFPEEKWSLAQIKPHYLEYLESLPK